MFSVYVTALQAVVASRWGELRLSTADHQADQSAEWLVIEDPASFMERMLREAGATLTSLNEDRGAITMTAKLPGGLVTPSVRLSVTAEPVDGGFLVRSNARSAAPQMVDYGATFHAMRELRRAASDKRSPPGARAMSGTPCPCARRQDRPTGSSPVPAVTPASRMGSS